MNDLLSRLRNSASRTVSRVRGAIRRVFPRARSSRGGRAGNT